MTLKRETVEKLLADATRGPWGVMKPTDWIMAGMMHVAQVRGYGWLTGHGGDGPKLSDAEATSVQTANASLIASAPDLATALLTAWDERDALAVIAKKANEHLYGAISERDRARTRADAAEAKLAELEAENARLRESLSAMVGCLHRPHAASKPDYWHVTAGKHEVFGRAVSAAITALNKEPKP